MRCIVMHAYEDAGVSLVLSCGFTYQKFFYFLEMLLFTALKMD